ncbi:sensor histidine kinase [Massilia horti]|uniref:histidine kinase n=1 Tax=Massilia horti TaxID=2562153 RepID=A0A4Y9T0F1_9BURK|nr:ATP-binding protein [Massilia horti]TFW32234.1 HAMP domain-containing protein [Massilia horti]
MLSLRRRLVLVHLAVVLAIVAAAALVGWWELSRSVRGQLDAALLALAETEVGMLADATGGAIHVHEAPAGTAPPSLMRLDRLVQIIDANGNVLARSVNLGVARLPAPQPLLEQLAAGQTVYQTLPHVIEEPLRMVSVPATIGDRALAVQVAGSLDDVNHVLHAAVILFAGMAVSLLAAVGFAGAALTRKIFGAVDDIALKARRIGEANLDQRLPHPGADDEIGHLVDTLNDMLDRLERSFDVQRRFTADASHELRSPLSRLRTEIEVTLRRPRDAAEYIGTLRSCLEEVERMTKLVEELLMLARLDAGQEHTPSETVSLNDLAKETLWRLEPRSREREIKIVLDAGPSVTARIAYGPASLVLTNLLENAVKFSPSGGQVTVRVAADGDSAVLSVDDQGPGIAADDLPFVFDRFYRGAGARAGVVEGVGLGLALSQAIAHAYGGRIEAANRQGKGALFKVLFPLAA